MSKFKVIMSWVGIIVLGLMFIRAHGLRWRGYYVYPRVGSLPEA